jgi:hypothetical protein
VSFGLIFNAANAASVLNGIEATAPLHAELIEWALEALTDDPTEHEYERHGRNSFVMVVPGTPWAIAWGYSPMPDEIIIGAIFDTSIL